jgi:DNA-binding transcriptional LysR family regulator
MPRLAELNLNLLLVLDALLRERGVTRAGARVGLSQPAASAALAQLRRFFNDQLLVRSRRGYELTPLALGLAQPVSEIIAMIERTVAGGEVFDPSRAEREFSIAVSDYVLMILVPALLPAVARAAPRVRLRIIPLESARGHPLERLADVLVVPESFATAEQEELFRDRWVFAAARGHPEVGARLDLKLLRRLPQVRYSIGSVVSAAQAHLDAIGLGRPAEVSVGSYVAALFLLRGTRLITLTPQRLARRLQSAAGVRIVRPPFRIPDLVECMVWPPVFNRDAGHMWLREMIRAVARGL